MTAPRANPAADADREIVLTRVFDAPRRLVWQAFTDSEHVPQWWGPRGFTTTTHRMEVRPGGVWRFVMHGPDGRDYDNLIKYLEVVEPERLVYEHGGDATGEPVNFTVTVTFAEADGAADRTKVTLRMVFPSRHARDFVVREYNAIEGGKQTLARLGEHLQAMRGDGAAPPAERPFVISRVLRAPRHLVWRAWTERDHLMRWFGPKGCTIPACTLDLRPGGTFHFCMRSANAPDQWGKWVFREIVEPERLVFVLSFADATGKVIRPPLLWPRETLTTVSFADHAGKGQGTLVTVRSSPLDATEAEGRAFAAGHESMHQGWTGTLDQLTDHLARASDAPAD